MDVEVTVQLLRMRLDQSGLCEEKEAELQGLEVEVEVEV